ncbi:GDSL-type esterase/lipase family protein [Bacteroides sp. AN502(2024)]|uniref:GDSL-type esterase/lipase family protein n=1 Tax=Bacteroides sp. AN502(2024) TaxID=3160599 RepID=UPI00351824EC
MRVFKKQISACETLLCASVLFNILLLGVVIVAERQGHVFSMVLERRDIVHLDDRSHSDYWARMGWTNTIEKLHTEFDVAFFGNSITRGSDFQLFFPEKKIINLGYSGDNMIGMLRRIPMLKAANPHKVFIMAGTNDLVHISLDDYEVRYTKLLQAIKDSLPNTKIYIESVLPSNHSLGNYTPNEKVQKANFIAKDLASKFNGQFINLYDLYVDDNNELPQEWTRDGVHLYPEHYDKWANAIKTMIYE